MRAPCAVLRRDVARTRLKSEPAAEITSGSYAGKLVKLRTTLVNLQHVSAQGRSSRKRVFSPEGSSAAAAKWSVTARVEGSDGQKNQPLNEGIKRLDEQLAVGGEQLVGQKNLVSIKGIGPRAAAILLAVIGEVRNFESEEKLASYYGIVPRVLNSNETVQHGRITKRGSKLGRTCLVQCTSVAKKYST